jgi:predicted ArsR family transcriptional regulator
LQKFIDAGMRAVGRLHICLCRIPGIGESLARALSAYLSIFPWLGGMRRTASIAETREHLIRSGRQMGFPFEFSEIDGNEFILELPYCPYGFDAPGEERACDTAMDMDRLLLKRCGAELTISETIPKGARRCRMIVRQDS